MLPARLDRFQRVSERDRWGLGECADALDTQHRNAPVVLKRLPAVAAAQHARVEAAVRSLEPLRHSTIVPVEGYGFDGDVPFLVVEPVEGESLRAWIDRHNAALRWPELAEVRALFDGACAAVAVAHRMRALAGAPVLHGLLSPESVLLGSGGDVCVMDFALSTLPGVAWSPSPTGLTSDPRAPEQLADPEAVSTASDVFSLGVLLASMLVPFAFPVRPKCWAHAVEGQPGGARALLQSMRGDVPPALYDELAKALSLDPRERHADADKLRTALRRAGWEPVDELAPPPRFVDHVEVPARERAEEHSRPMMRLPSALLADTGPSPMNLRASVATQRIFHDGIAPPAPAPAEEPAPDTALILEPPPEDTVSTSARSFEAPSAPTTVDALQAFRHFARASIAEEPVEEPTGPLSDEFFVGSSDGVQVPGDDLFSAELAAQAVAPTPPMGRARVVVREPTKALLLSPEVFGANPTEGMLVAGVKLQSLVLKAPPRPPARHEGTRVRVVAPADDPPPDESFAGDAFASAAYVDESMNGDAPSDPWVDGEPDPRPSFAPPSAEWEAAPRPATMAPPRRWTELSPFPVIAPELPPSQQWNDSPPTAVMNIPLPVSVPPPAPAKRPSSLAVGLLVAALVVAAAFLLGVIAGR